LSLIRVEGDSMQPTLNDGDDIMVDTVAAEHAIKKGIYVLRLDGTLMVKRLLPVKGGIVSILSDNPSYIAMEGVAATAIKVIGRVVWVGRRL
jgi:phage repressor protein C with HTH and peptisase S24 domain